MVLAEKYSWSWVVVIVLGIIIYYVSSLPGSDFAQGGLGIKPIVYHVFVFFLFAFFLILALSKGRSKTGIVFGFLISLIYAFLDEYHQNFVPGRHASFLDVFLDFVGIVFALMLYLIILVYAQDKRG